MKQLFFGYIVFGCDFSWGSQSARTRVYSWGQDKPCSLTDGVWVLIGTVCVGLS